MFVLLLTSFHLYLRLGPEDLPVPERKSSIEPQQTALGPDELECATETPGESLNIIRSDKLRPGREPKTAFLVHFQPRVD